jgi:hypothetical protein
MDKCSRLWVFVGLVAAAFAIALAMAAGRRLDDEALDVLIGIAGGVGATVLAGAGRLLGAQQRHRGHPLQTLRATDGLAVEVWSGDDVSRPLLKLRNLAKTGDAVVDVVVIWPAEVEPLVATLAEALEILGSEPAGPVLLSQIPSLTDAEVVLAEGEYRRGYRDGWIQAAGAMGDLMGDRQLTWQAAYAVCWRHWETALLPWTWTQ